MISPAVILLIDEVMRVLHDHQLTSDEMIVLRAERPIPKFDDAALWLLPIKFHYDVERPTPAPPVPKTAPPRKHAPTMFVGSSAMRRRWR